MHGHGKSVSVQRHGPPPQPPTWTGSKPSASDQSVCILSYPTPRFLSSLTSDGWACTCSRAKAEPAPQMGRPHSLASLTYNASIAGVPNGTRPTLSFKHEKPCFYLSRLPGTAQPSCESDRGTSGLVVANSSAATIPMPSRAAWPLSYLDKHRFIIA